jgi:hypothetical protein
LIHVNLSNPFVLKIDTYDYALGVVLSQPIKDNLFHPVGFCSYKFYLANINYEIHDKDLLAIVDAFKEWYHLLEGTQHEIIVYSNHKNF